MFDAALASANAASMAQPAQVTTTNNTTNNNTLSSWERAGACLRMVGGGVQIGAGLFAVANVEIPVAAQVAGGIAIAHGYSDVEIGSRQCFTGQRGQDSLFQQTVSATAQLAGADRQTADRIGVGADIVGGFINPAGPAAGTPGLLAEASNGQRLVVAATNASSLPAHLADASNAIHATTTLMSVANGEGGEKTEKTEAAEESTSGEQKPIPDAQRLSDAEQATAGRLMAQRPDIKLSESPHVGAEYVDQFGRSYDQMGKPAASTYWNERQFLRSIDEHLLKSNDYTVIDLTDFTPAQRQVVSNYVDGLSQVSRDRIIRIGF